MRVGPYLRRKISFAHEIARKSANKIDYFFWLMFDPAKFKRIENEKIKRILVVLIGGKKGNLGGDFCVLGVLNYFHKVYPKVKIYLLGNESGARVWGKIHGINIIVYRGRGTLNELKKKNIDGLIYLSSGELRMKDFMFIPYRIGMPTNDVSSFLSLEDRLFFTRKVSCPWETHMVDFRFAMLEALGFKFKEKKLVFYYSKKEEQKVSDFLKKNKIGKFVVIHPGGKFMMEILKKGKCPPHLWELNRYAEVAEYFSKKGYKIIITGSKEESELAEKIKKFGGRVIDCCGKFSIRESGVLLKKSKLLIATDTSIVHLAYQVGTPIVELMGPSFPELVGAWPLNSPKHKIIFHEGPCAKSMRKMECPEGIPCMDNISVEEVIKAGNELLNER